MKFSFPEAFLTFFHHFHRESHVAHPLFFFLLDSLDCLVDFLHEGIVAQNAVYIVEKCLDAFVYVMHRSRGVQKDFCCSILQFKILILRAEIAESVDVPAFTERVEGTYKDDDRLVQVVIVCTR